MWKKKKCPSPDFKKKLIASLQKSHMDAICGMLLNNKLTLSFRILLSTKTLFHALQHNLYKFLGFYYNFRYFFSFSFYTFPGLNTRFSHKKLGIYLISRHNQAHHNSSIEQERQTAAWFTFLVQNLSKHMKRICICVHSLPSSLLENTDHIPSLIKTKVTAKNTS